MLADAARQAASPYPTGHCRGTRSVPDACQAAASALAGRRPPRTACAPVPQGGLHAEALFSGTELEAIDCCHLSGAMLMRPGLMCSCCCSACRRHAALSSFPGCSQTSACGKPAAASCLRMQGPTCGCSGGLGIQVPGLCQGSSPFSAAHLHLAGNVRHDDAGSHCHSSSTVQVPGKVAVLDADCTQGIKAGQSHQVGVQGSGISQARFGFIKVACPLIQYDSLPRP